VVATDMERSMTVATEMVTADTPGVAVFPHKRMLDIMRSATEGQVRIRVAGGIANIVVGATMWKLPLMPGHDFPALPEITEATYVTVDKDAFATAINSVKHAASKEAERAPLMMINCAGGKMVASDGSRFQQATIGDLPFDFQIPIGAVSDLLKLMKNSEETRISIGESRHHLIFSLAADQFIVGKLVAQFPDTERMLLRPALENKHKLSVDRDELRDAIRRVRIAADTNTSAIVLRLATDSLTVVARDTLKNEAEEPIPAGWNGPERSLAVNHAFLTDMLRAHGPKDAVFWLGDDTKTRRTPLMLKDPDAGTVGVVQQMNLDWVGA
jgi:DNA polymerase III subunit beta